jgi:hypothetical protein
MITQPSTPIYATPDTAPAGTRVFRHHPTSGRIEATVTGYVHESIGVAYDGGGSEVAPLSHKVWHVVQVAEESTPTSGTYSTGDRVTILGVRGGFTYVTFTSGRHEGTSVKVPSSWVTPDPEPIPAPVTTPERQHTQYVVSYSDESGARAEHTYRGGERADAVVMFHEMARTLGASGTLPMLTDADLPFAGWYSETTLQHGATLTGYKSDRGNWSLTFSRLVDMGDETDEHDGVARFDRGAVRVASGEILQTWDEETETVTLTPTEPLTWSDVWSGNPDTDKVAAQDARYGDNPPIWATPRPAYWE